MYEINLKKGSEQINRNLVINAQNKLEQGELNQAKQLFEESKKICQ